MNIKNSIVCMSLLFFGMYTSLQLCCENILRPQLYCCQGIFEPEVDVTTNECCGVSYSTVALTLTSYTCLQNLACYEPCTCSVPVSCIGCCCLTIGDQLPTEQAVYKPLQDFYEDNPIYKNKVRAWTGRLNAQLHTIEEDPEEHF